MCLMYHTYLGFVDGPKRPKHVQVRPLYFTGPIFLTHIQPTALTDHAQTLVIVALF